MALRALSPLGSFPYDVPHKLECDVPKILAVSEHAILWRQTSQIDVNSMEFPAAARRLLRQDPLANPNFPWLWSPPNDLYNCRLFLTPLAPMKAGRLAHDATCVLPVPVPNKDGITTAAAFATATRLFVPVAVHLKGLAIVSFASSSPLFDSDVTYEVSMHLNFPGYLPSDVSLTVEEHSPLSDPDHISLLSYETWIGFSNFKKCTYRYVASLSTGKVMSSECLMEQPVDFREIHHHRGDAAQQAARLVGRRILSGDDLSCLNLRPLQESRIFEPVKLFTKEGSWEELTLLLPGGGRTAISLDLKREESVDRRKYLLERSVSVASSRAGRVVVRLENTVYTGIYRGALPLLEEASRAACYALLSEHQKHSLHRATALDFSSFQQFCTDR